MTSLLSAEDDADSGRVFALAAELFGLLSTPMRLRILSALCDGERSVSQLLERIDTTQPNLSQHLNVLYRSGVLAKRKEGTQVIYRVQSEKAVTLCRELTDLARDEAVKTLKALREHEAERRKAKA